MDKGFLEELDKSEHLRVSKRIQEAVKKGEMNAKSFFKSEAVSRTLEQKNQAILSGFQAEILPNIVPFSKCVFVEVCPDCGCTRNPELIKPYLDRQFVIPILGATYVAYPKHFIDLMLGYPHISCHEFYNYRNLALIQQKGIKRLTPDKVDNYFKKSRSLAKHFSSDRGLRKWAQKTIRGQIFVNLEPFLYPDYEVLSMLVTALQKKDENEFDRIRVLTHIIREFRSAQVFPVVPQIEIEHLETLELIEHRPNMQADYDLVEIRDLVMKGLRLSYDTSLPLETYLDVVTDRKHKIQRIVDDIIQKASTEKEILLSSLQREVERVNQEVETLKSSKRRVIIDLVTNFALQNKSIVSGFVIGAGLGIGGLGLIGCGTGVLSGLLAKAVSKTAKVSWPKEKNELTRKLSTVLEPHYEKFLAEALSKDLRVVQIWQLRKRITK